MRPVCQVILRIAPGELIDLSDQACQEAETASSRLTVLERNGCESRQGDGRAGPISRDHRLAPDLCIGDELRSGDQHAFRAPESTRSGPAS